MSRIQAFAQRVRFDGATMASWRGHMENRGNGTGKTGLRRKSVSDVWRSIVRRPREPQRNVLNGARNARSAAGSVLGG